MKKSVFVMICLLTAFLFSGCASLNPSSRVDVKSPWKTYDEARIAYEKIIPYETTAENLKKMGIDPYSTPNITILSPTDIANIFLPNQSIKKEDLDPGVQKCLANRSKCKGFVLAPNTINRDSLKSNFWLHFFGFKKIFRDTGWEFKGIIILMDDVVVYKDPSGGRAVIDKEETINKPLGPLQDGDHLIDTGKKILLP